MLGKLVMLTQQGALRITHSSKRLGRLSALSAKATLVLLAANDSLEPTPEVSKSCCARSQRMKCRMSKKFGASLQRKERSFMHAAATIRRRIHRSRDRPPVRRSAALANRLNYCSADFSVMRGIQGRPRVITAISLDPGKRPNLNSPKVKTETSH